MDVEQNTPSGQRGLNFRQFSMIEIVDRPRVRKSLVALVQPSAFRRRLDRAIHVQFVPKKIINSILKKITLF